MNISRRSLFKFLLASAATAAVAEEIDIERLLWVPKPIITVPELAYYGRHNMGQIVAQCWGDAIAVQPLDSLFSSFWLLHELRVEDKDARKIVVITDIE